MATGAYFSYKNYADTAALSAYNSQTYQAALPLANLQDHRLSKKARTTGTTHGFAVGIDLNAVRNTKVVALCGLNFSSNDPAYSSNALVYTVTFSNTAIGSTDVGQFQETGYLENTFSGMPPNVFIVPNGNAGFTARYLSVVATWSQSGGAYFEAGRLWVGDAIVLPGAVEEGWSQTIQDLSTIQRSRGGQIYADIRQRYRNTKIDVKSVPRQTIFPLANSGYATFQEMFLNAGMSTEIVALLRSSLGTGTPEDDYSFMMHTGVYGVFSQKPSVTNSAGDNYNISMELDESL